jgi:hypothetical protein
VSEHRIGDRLVRQGYACSECGCIKDGYDPEMGVWVNTRWCWNVRAHESHARRKMHPVALSRYVNRLDAPHAELIATA